MTINELAPWIAIAITLILLILVPLFTQISNNNFQLNMKKMDHEAEIQKKKIFAYEEFFRNVGGCIIFAQKEDIVAAGGSIQRLYTYLPEEEWDTLDKLFDEIKNYEWESARTYMQCISKWIANETKG